MTVLEINNIDLHYGAAQILHQVSVSADAASVTCIMGRNGVGKTSLLKAKGLNRSAVYFRRADFVSIYLGSAQ